MWLPLALLATHRGCGRSCLPSSVESKYAIRCCVARDLLTLLPQYVCVGYALYDEEKLRQQREESKKSPMAPVELPYCEGERPLSHLPCPT